MRACSRRPDSALDWSVQFREQDEPGRLALERFVHDCFADVFGADVARYLPGLMGIEDGRGDLLGVIGWRPAARGPLYLEHYLPAPIESTISALCGAPVARASIVEVGNLATALKGGNRSLVTTLAHHLRARGHEWVACTATRPLRNSFLRMGVGFLDAGPALPTDVPDGETWGAYYEAEPRVLAVALAPMLAAVAGDGNLSVSHAGLWQQAREAARAVVAAR